MSDYLLIDVGPYTTNLIVLVGRERDAWDYCNNKTNSGTVIPISLDQAARLRELGIPLVKVPDYR